MSPDAFSFADLSAPSILLIALILNLIACSMSRVGSVFGLPQAYAARLIQTFEQRYSSAEATEAMRRADSISVTLVLLIIAVGVGLLAHFASDRLPFGWAIDAVLIAPLLSVRPHLERMDVLRDAAERGEEDGQATLTLITGRDSRGFDRSAIAAAGIESTAMAFTQGVVAPILWYLVAGLPGLFAVKILDTASAIVDERSDHARSFGWAQRCLAALSLWPAALLSGPLIVFGGLFAKGAHPLEAVRALGQRRRYAWPVFSLTVAAMAGALQVRLGGPVCIGSFRRDGDIFEPEFSAPGAEDLQRARAVFLAAGMLVAVLLAIWAMAATGRFEAIFF